MVNRMLDARYWILVKTIHLSLFTASVGGGDVSPNNIL